MPNQTRGMSFGCRLWAGLAAVYFCTKGFAGTTLQLCLLPLFKTVLGASSTDYQKYTVVIMAPWSIKPIAAVAADSFGITRPMVGILAVVGSAAVGTLVARLPTVTAHEAVALAFLGSLEIAFIDILAEGEYAHIMAASKDPGLKRSIVSAVWALVFAGQLGSSIAVGRVDTPVMLTAAAVLLAVPLAPAACQCLFTARTTTAWTEGNKLAVVMTVVALGIIPVTAADASSAAAKTAYVTVSGVGLVALGFYWLPRRLARANTYMFASSVLYIPVNGAVDYWFTAEPECVPGGPHFDLQYYISVGAVVSSIFAAIGVMVFNSCFKGWGYRQMFWVTTAIRIVAASTDVVILNRWNIMVGVSDKTLFLVGDAALQPLAAALETMPMVLLTSELATGGAESTTYAILAGFQNFGGAIATTYGYLLQDRLGVSFLGDNDCSYEYIARLVGVAHILLPTLAVPLTFALID
jgi:hypothetical protein